MHGSSRMTNLTLTLLRDHTLAFLIDFEIGRSRMLYMFVLAEA